MSQTESLLEQHYRNLESMYQAAPVNAFYLPEMLVDHGIATIEIPLKEAFTHSAGGVHGSVYFKMLDDAAFFAANSLETEVFVLTSSFTTYMTRPVPGVGRMKSVGKVVNQTKTQFIAESIVYDEQDREIGRGNGIFVRGRTLLTQAKGYCR